jgi:Fe-S-cluster-containing dehydrogenase component
MIGGGAAAQPSAEFLKEARVKKFMEVLAKELRDNTGKAIVIAGRRQPPEVHAIVARINQTLGAVGKTLEYYEDPEPERQTHVASITTLAKDMAAGAVQTLFIFGGNPVYDAPADLDFAGALAKVGTSIHLSEYQNETSAKTSWHVPKAHYLEAWGDVRTWDGTVTLAQPLIAPIFGGISSIELMSMLLGEDKSGIELVKAANNVPGIDLAWNQSVHDGFIRGTQLPAAQGLAVGNFAVPELSRTQRSGTNPKADVLEVTYHYSSHSYDGRYANNAWLQETPDFLSKVCWDNYAVVNPDTADAFGIANDTMIKVKVGEREVEIACYTMAGQARNSIALVLGGGRTMAGRVGGSEKDARRVGWNTYKVRTSTAFDFALDAKVSSAGGKYELASVQEHQDIRTGLSPSVNQDGIQERLPELIKEVRNDALQGNKNWHAEEEAEFWDDERLGPSADKRHLSLFKEKEYAGHRWGMAIDLTTCTGCNSCMVACQSENNVPVVGRKEIFNNREMHWIRIDRYFSGSKDDPQIVYQPVACQQCENAPCEQVCPVGATSHSDEGLNDQAYNRCIGTRYCANNCPYKVRKFNFLDWNKEWREARNKVRRLLFNPDVTVRMRGVMEKCTFCVQRIEAAKIHARAQIRNPTPSSSRSLNSESPPDGIEDGEIVTACQQACPTEAIVFGDLADKKSRVSRLHEDRRQYTLLPETYTKPRNKFLARVKNPNKDLVPAPASSGHGNAGGHE